MSICTFNFYQIFWFYRNWRLIEDREPEGRSPLGRAVFAVFYCYQCFIYIRNYGYKSSSLSLVDREGELEGSSSIDPDQRLAAAPLAIGWIAVTLFSRLLSLRPIPGLSGQLSWFWICTVLFLLPVQTYANRVNAAASPSHNRNARLTIWNWLVVGPIAIRILFALAGTFFPSSEP